MKSRMTTRGRWALAIGVATALAAGAAPADELSDLRERLEAQEQKIRVLERKLELNDEATKAAIPTTPVVRANPQQGFRIQSPDSANVARLRGVLHFDGRRYLDDITPEIADTWILRRVRPTLRRHVQRHLRLSLHAGFRAAAARSSRTRSSPHASSRGRRHRRQVQGAGRTRAPRVGHRPALHRARASDEPRCRIAISVCNSAATLQAASSTTPSATSTA